MTNDTTPAIRERRRELNRLREAAEASGNLSDWEEYDEGEADLIEGVLLGIATGRFADPVEVARLALGVEDGG